MADQRKCENDSVPALRFEGFSDPWEQRKVHEVLSIVVRSVDLKDDEEYQLITVKRRNEGIVQRTRAVGKDILVKNYQEILAGDFVISKRQLVHGGNGLVPEHLARSIVSNEYLVIVGNKDISTNFWALISRTAGMYRQYFLSSFGVDIEKLVFDVDDWRKRLIVLPQIEEQRQMESLFAKLDSLITLHQRKVDKLKTVKQSLLEKMFPREGENVPEIRFEGFTDPWEQRRLGELGSARSGVGFPNAEQGGGEGTPFYKVSDMNLEGNELQLRQANNYVTDEQIERKRWKPINEVPAMFFAKVGAAVLLNRKRLVDEPFLLDNNTMAYSFDRQLWDVAFGRILFDGLDLTSLVQVGALPSYNASDVESMEVTIPLRIEEQSRIGLFFQKLDSLITLHQRELEILKNLKQACLEKMFV